MNSLEARSKSTLTRLNDGEGKTYPKLKGRHVHRTVAEMLLGRKLLSGEIVHHIDNDKRNFSINNLKVFRSQAEMQHITRLYKKEWCLNEINPT
jgi:hypothetical protein